MSHIFVDGNYRSVSGALRTVLNPANSSVLGEVAECSEDDVALGVAAAERALPAWSSLSEDDRYSILQSASEALRGQTEALSGLLVAEGGLTQREARATLAAALTDLRYPSANVPQRAGAVRAVLGPASSPLLPIVRQVTAAVMAGDTVVLAPAKGAVLANLAMGAVWSALPPGVVNVLTGDVVGGQRLTSHAGVQAISFTGSATVAAVLAQTGKLLEACVGATDMAIVRRDADIDLAVRAIAWSRLRHGGRACQSSRRVYVDAAIAQDFVVRLHEYVGLLEVDDPQKEASVLGPLGSAESAKACEGRVVKSMREGARLVLGGFRFRPSGLKGYWLQPTILADILPGMLPMREDMAGPVLTVSSYRDDQELRSWLDESTHPVGLSLYGADVDELSAWAASTRAQAVWVNVPQSDYAPPPLAGSRPTYRPAYASGALPDFYSLDPLRVWSLT